MPFDETHPISCHSAKMIHMPVMVAVRRKPPKAVTQPITSERDGKNECRNGATQRKTSANL